MPICCEAVGLLALIREDDEGCVLSPPPPSAWVMSMVQLLAPSPPLVACGCPDPWFGSSVLRLALGSWRVAQPASHRWLWC
jgi:hypothetical protein